MSNKIVYAMGKVALSHPSARAAAIFTNPVRPSHGSFIAAALD